MGIPIGNLELSIKTCSAGHIYAVPTWAYAYYWFCPFCLQAEAREMHKEIASLQKTISGLKGEITKLRGKK